MVATPDGTDAAGTMESNVADVNVVAEVRVEENEASESSGMILDTNRTRYPLEVYGNVSEENYGRVMEEINRAVREMEEKNLTKVERNGITIERQGGRIVVKVPGVEMNVGEKTIEAIHRITKRVGISLDEENLGKLLREGHVVMEMKVGRKLVRKEVRMELNLVIGKDTVFDEENGVAEVNVVVSAEKGGVYLVEQNIPKTEGNVEIDVPPGVVVINFDPVIAWVAELAPGEERNVSYRVYSTVPPEISDRVAELGSCNVRVEEFNVVKKGSVISGAFKVLLGDVPVYTKDISVSGEFSFIKDGMYYVFQGNEPVIVEGRVGDCRFYKEIRYEGPDYTPVVMAFLVLVLLVGAYLYFKA